MSARKNQKHRKAARQKVALGNLKRRLETKDWTSLGKLAIALKKELLKTNAEWRKKAPKGLKKEVFIDAKAILSTLRKVRRQIREEDSDIAWDNRENKLPDGYCHCWEAIQDVIDGEEKECGG